MFGISLAVKQFALFLAPLWLIIVWPDKKKLAISILSMALVPTIVSLRLFLDAPAGMIKGVLFAVTRSNEANMGAPSIDAIAGAAGIQSAIFMLLPVALVYIIAHRKRLPIAVSGMAIMLIVLAFNTVIFNQYFPWMIALAILAMSEYVDQHKLPRVKSKLKNKQ